MIRLYLKPTDKRFRLCFWVILIWYKETDDHKIVFCQHPHQATLIIGIKFS